MNITNINDLIYFVRPILIGGHRRNVPLFCKPLMVNKFETGLIESYEVLVIYEVESYLRGDNTASSRVEKFSTNSVPIEISTYF